MKAVPNDGDAAVVVTTTRTHGMAIVMYFMFVILGVLHTSGVTVHTSIDLLIGESWGHIWSLWHIPVGVACLVGVAIASVSTDPRLGTWIEFFGCLGIVVIKTLYLTALLHQRVTAVTTQVLVMGLLFGALATMVQIIWDQSKVKAAVDMNAGARDVDTRRWS